MIRVSAFTMGLLAGVLLGYHPTPVASRSAERAVPPAPRTEAPPAPPTPPPAPAGSHNPARSGPGRTPRGAEPARLEHSILPSRVLVSVPEPAPVAERKHGVRGRVSWYCRPGSSACTAGFPASGRYAAACPELRRQLGDWRGRTVTVVSGDRSVRVRLVDTCAHRGRLVDLYASAFAQLAPLSRGVLAVEVIP